MNVVYEHAGISIVHGDAREVLPELHGDAVIADVPYGVDLASWDSLPVQHDLDLCRAASSGGPVVWFGSARPDCMRALLGLFPLATRVYVWYRGFSYSRSDGTFWQWQPIYAWGALKNLGRDVLTAHRVDACGSLHPMQKPEGLMRDLIQAATKPGDLVIDPYCGSGTVARACKDTGRRCVSIDISREWCDVAARRLEGPARRHGQDVLRFQETASS